MKVLRTIVGAALIVFGFLFTIIPGSILLVLVGLVFLSIDYPPVRRFLASIQRYMSRSAKKIDLFFYQRKQR